MNKIDKKVAEMFHNGFIGNFGNTKIIISDECLAVTLFGQKIFTKSDDGRFMARPTKSSATTCARLSALIGHPVGRFRNRVAIFPPGSTKGHGDIVLPLDHWTDVTDWVGGKIPVVKEVKKPKLVVTVKENAFWFNL